MLVGSWGDRIQNEINSCAFLCINLHGSSLPSYKLTYQFHKDPTIGCGDIQFFHIIVVFDDNVVVFVVVLSQKPSIKDRSKCGQ